MDNINIRHIFERTINLIFSPEKEWDIIKDERVREFHLFRNYYIPLNIVSFLVIVMSLSFTKDIYYSLTIGLIHLISMILSGYITFKIVKEYLTDKVKEPGKISIQLSVYTCSVFVLFHSLSECFSSGFFAQLMSVLSFIYVRTLYIGIKQIVYIDPKSKTNLLAMIGLLVIFMAIALERLLMIVLRVPIINA